MEDKPKILFKPLADSKQSNCGCYERHVYEYCDAHKDRISPTEWRANLHNNWPLSESSQITQGDWIRLENYIESLLTTQSATYAAREKEVVEQEKTDIYHAIGMLDGVYFKKPEEGFNGEVQYIPKHIALNVVNPDRMIDENGNHIDLLQSNPE